jgi:hypothetical protein
MADVSLGTFEVTAMSQMNPGGMTPPVATQLPGPPGGTQPPPVPPPTYNVAMLQIDPPEGAGPGSLNISGLASSPVAMPFDILDVHLGTRYEVILREVLAR